MVLHVHSDASHLSKSQARSRTRGYFLSDMSKNPQEYLTLESPTLPTNGVVHVLSTILKSFLVSESKTESATLFYNARKLPALRTTLQELGHPQLPTPIQTDNKCIVDIADNTVKQCRSNVVDMRYFWIIDQTKQGQFYVHWCPGTDNIADYSTKYHSLSHHHVVCLWYLLCSQASSRLS